MATNLPDLLKQRILTRAEAGMLSHGYRRLAHIRIRLHLNAKRAEDRLLFDLQPQVAESMGYQDENRRRQSEELMRVFYRAVKTVKQLGGILTPMLRSRVSSTPVRVTLRIDDDYIQVNNQIAARHRYFFRRANTFSKSSKSCSSATTLLRSNRKPCAHGGGDAQNQPQLLPKF